MPSTGNAGDSGRDFNFGRKGVMGKTELTGRFGEGEAQGVSERGRALGGCRCDLCDRFAIYRVGNVVLCGLHFAQLESKTSDAETPR